MSNNEFHQRRLSATPRGAGVMCNFFAQSAQNATLWPISKAMSVIDFAAGIAVLNTGHRHPRVVAAVERAAAGSLPIPPIRLCLTKAMFRWRRSINDLAPVDGPAKTAFFTTGAEAVENAVKIARAHTGRPGVDRLRRRLPRPYLYDHGPNR